MTDPVFYQWLITLLVMIVTLNITTRDSDIVFQLTVVTFRSDC